VPLQCLIPREAATAHNRWHCQPKVGALAATHFAALCDSVAPAKLHSAAECITVLEPRTLLKLPLLLPETVSALRAAPNASVQLLSSCDSNSGSEDECSSSGADELT
jgi:hypothetical protein